jgi:hypothetical protein
LVVGWAPNLCALGRPRPLFSGLSCRQGVPLSEGVCGEGFEEVLTRPVVRSATTCEISSRGGIGPRSTSPAWTSAAGDAKPPE